MAKNKKKTSEKSVMIFTLDTETRGLFGHVFRIGLYNGIEYWTFNQMEECYEILKDYAKKYDVHVYIHNLDFDLSKIAGTILEDVDLNNSIFIEQNVAVFGTTTNIILHDSLKLLPSSLEKICKDFGLGEASKIDLTNYLNENGYKDKGDYFNRVDPEEEMLNLYLKFDCTSLHTVIMQLITISGLTIEEFIKCPTTASLAMKVYKELYPDDYEDVCSSNFKGEYGEFIEEILRQGYYGGRTEVFLPHLLGGYHYDVNSLYPYVMKVNEFPIGYYDVYQDKQAARMYHYWKTTKKGGGFAWVKIHVPETLNIPPLPHRAKTDKALSSKLIFPTGNLDGVWAFPEIEMAEKYGCVIEKIEEVIYFRKTYPVFKEFVEQFEELKTKSKGAKRTFAKLMQNSLYGKFGMNRNRRALLPIEELEEVKESGEPYSIFYHPKMKRQFIQTNKKVHAKYIQPHIAAYVTAYARILLYEGLMNPSNGEVAYCDTDSIACQNEFAEELVHDSEYGKWKLENKLEYGIFLQPKLYMEKNIDGELTTKAKGIPGNIRAKFTEETYNEILNKIKSGADRIEFFGSENSLFDKEVFTRKKFVSMLKNGEDFDTALKIRKGMNLRAKQKRQIDYYHNSSKPHHLIEWGRDYDNLMVAAARQEEQNEIKELNNTDLIKEKIKQIGFIKCIQPGEQYYEEYKNMSVGTRSKYFRKAGIPIDLWCEEASEDIKELMGEWGRN